MAVEELCEQTERLAAREIEVSQYREWCDTEGMRFSALLANDPRYMTGNQLSFVTYLCHKLFRLAACVTVVRNREEGN